MRSTYRITSTFLSLGLLFGATYLAIREFQARSEFPMLVSTLAPPDPAGPFPSLRNLSRNMVIPTLIVAPNPVSVDVINQGASERGSPWDKLDSTRVAYAATELQDHLKEAGINVSLTDSADQAIRLLLWGSAAADSTRTRLAGLTHLTGQGFAIVPGDDGITIVGETSLGVLYGVYRFMQELGFWWFDPTETRIPTLDSTEPREWQLIVEHPRVKWRGFHTYGNPASDSFLVWMARNRLNLIGPANPKLAEKLGISLMAASHEYLAEELSQEGIFEEHPEWFGRHRFRRQRITLGESYFNPAFSNQELGQHIANRMVERLSDGGDLDWANILALWPSDSRSGTFEKTKSARSIGNKSDNLLFFYSNIADHIENARSRGILERPVTLAGISYYETWEKPTNSLVVESLRDHDFVQVHYTNERDWHGSVIDPNPWNAANINLLNNLAAWQETRLPSGICEYHNYSTFSGIALTDFLTLFDNVRSMAQIGGDQIYCYMHPLRAQAGPRRFLDLGIARATWISNQVNDTGEEFRSRYFNARYGSLADEWLTVHKMMGQSFQNVRQMFAFSSLQGLLFQHRNYANPPYSEKQVTGFLEAYESGGDRKLPARVDMLDSEFNSFMGLSESLALQHRARDRWEAILEMAPAELRSVLNEDISWFTNSLLRYEMLSETVDMYRYLHDPALRDPTRAAQAARHILTLADSVNQDLFQVTVSGMDQSFVLDPYREWAEEVLLMAN